MKKLLCALLSLALAAAAFTGCSDKQSGEEKSASKNEGTVSDSEVTPNSTSDFVYREESGEITITGYKGSAVTVNIPSEIEGKPVVSIGEYAFDGYEKPDENNTTGKHYKPNNINSIVSVHIPSSVKTIEKGAFTNCYSMTELSFAEGVETICEGAFACCDALKGTALPDSLLKLDSYAFFECFSLQNISFGGNLQSVGEYAFYDCNELLSVAFPASLKSIGMGCFAGCDYLSEVSLKEGLASVDEKAFFACSSLTETELPESLTSIGSYAFGYTLDNSDSSDNSKEIPVEGFVIKGKKGSEAEKYAESGKLTFKS